MRLWPYQMLKYLPTKQLVAQWRECLAISGMIYGDGTNVSLENINHATINRMKEYPLEHFAVYCDLVREAFKSRGFTIGTNTIEKLDREIGYSDLKYRVEEGSYDGIPEKLVHLERMSQFLFCDFHTKRYVRQCMYSFQEKLDCGMLDEDEWKLLCDNFGHLMQGGQ